LIPKIKIDKAMRRLLPDFGSSDNLIAKKSKCRIIPVARIDV